MSAAALMCRVRGRSDFTPWVDGLLFDNGWIDRHCLPVVVSDPADGKMAHLDGLNFSRAWALRTIAAKIAPHPRVGLLEALARSHLNASIAAIDRHYMGSHWLASFALLALLA